MKTSKEEIAELKEYKDAYEYMLGYWESFEKEQKQQINKDLNKIFILNKDEIIDEDEFQAMVLEEASKMGGMKKIK